MLSYDEFYGLAKADVDRCHAEGNVPPELADKHPDCFLAFWETGGRSYSSGGERVRDAEPEAEIEPLLELLDDLGLKRRQVNEIRSMIFQGSVYRQPLDHNGSWADYGYKTLALDELHEKLVELGAVEPRPSPAP